MRAGKVVTNDGVVEDRKRFWRNTRGEERWARSVSRHCSERSRFGSPLRAGKDTETARAAVEDVPLHVKEHLETCLQKMGMEGGLFNRFWLYDINVKDSQEHLHVVVQSNMDRLVLPLPPLPPPMVHWLCGRHQFVWKNGRISMA